MKKLLAVLFLTTIMVAPALCETSIWTVKTDSTTTYIGGTIHLLRASDYPLPEEYDKAYEASSILVLETDFSKLQTIEFQQALMAEAMYTDGTTLDQVLSEEAWEEFEEFCVEKKTDPNGLKPYKPWMAMLSLMLAELQKMGVDGEGVDQHYYARALKDEKTLGQLETIETQLEAMTSMADDNESAFILNGLEQAEEMGDIFAKLIDAWKVGDVSFLRDELLAETKKEFPKLFKKMFVDRNNAWMPKVEEYIGTTETELILVGSGHLVGEEGVIDQLRKKGYKVEKL